MKYTFILSQIIVMVALVGCVTSGVSIRSINDPKTKVDQSALIYVDALRDTAIDYRNQLSSAPDAATKAGLKVTTNRFDAQYVVFLNFRLGLVYNVSRQEFEQRLSVSERATGVHVRNPSGRRFGIINAGLFSAHGDSDRTVWEGSIEVEDINDPKLVEHSLIELFKKVGVDFIGDVPRLSEK